MNSGRTPTTLSNSALPRPDRVPGLPGVLRSEMLYQNAYVWFVLMSALDLMLTRVVLWLGGSEVNWIAAKVIWYGDLYGLIAFKFALVVLVVLLCEAIGRARPPLGKRVSEWAVALTAVPVAIALLQIAIVYF